MDLLQMVSIDMAEASLTSNSPKIFSEEEEDLTDFQLRGLDKDEEQEEKEGDDEVPKGGTIVLDLTAKDAVRTNKKKIANDDSINTTPTQEEDDLSTPSDNAGFADNDKIKQAEEEALKEKNPDGYGVSHQSSYFRASDDDSVQATAEISCIEDTETQNDVSSGQPEAISKQVPTAASEAIDGDKYFIIMAKQETTIEELKSENQKLVVRNQQLQRERDSALTELEEVEALRQKIKELTFKNEKLKQQQQQQEEVVAIKKIEAALELHDDKQEEDMAANVVEEDGEETMEQSLLLTRSQRESLVSSTSNSSDVTAATTTMQELQSAMKFLHSASTEQQVVVREQETRQLQSQIGFMTMELETLRAERDVWRKDQQERQEHEKQEQAENEEKDVAVSPTRASSMGVGAVKIAEVTEAMERNDVEAEDDSDNEEWIVDDIGGQDAGNLNTNTATVILSTKSTEKAFSKTIQHMKASMEKLEEECQGLRQGNIEHKATIASLQEDLELRDAKLSILKDLVKQSIIEKSANATANVGGGSGNHNDDRKWKLAWGSPKQIKQLQQQQSGSPTSPPAAVVSLPSTPEIETSRRQGSGSGAVSGGKSPLRFGSTGMASTTNRSSSGRGASSVVSMPASSSRFFAGDVARRLLSSNDSSNDSTRGTTQDARRAMQRV